MDAIDPVLKPLFETPVERRVLDNGLTVIVKEDTSSEVSSVQLWVKTGSIHEGDFMGAGLSHYLEHMLFKGTNKRTGKEISRDVQSLGGYINAYTTFDRTVYYIDLPSENTLDAMDILVDAGFNSTLDADEVLKERDVILREIDMGTDDPDRQVGRALFETAYRTSPYRYPVIGYREVFETVTRDELLGYYEERYVPNNMVLIVTGAVKTQEIIAAAEKLCGSYPRKRLPEVFIADEPGQLAKRNQTLTGDVNLTRIGLAFKVPGLHHDDTPALKILGGILGNGESSILWQRLREEAELVFSVDVSIWNPGSSGVIWVSMVVAPEKKEAALAEFWKVMDELKETAISEGELRKAKRQVIVGEVDSRKTMSGQASRLGAAEVVVGDLMYSEYYLSRINAVTTDQLRNLMNEYVVEQGMTQIIYEPEVQTSDAVENPAVDADSKLFDEVELKNGAKLLFQPGKGFPKVHLRLVFMGGAVSEPSDQRGVTALMATMLTRDTVKRSALEVATLIESVGGSFNEFAGNNTFGLGIEVLEDDIDLAVELIEDALFSLNMQEDTFNREREGQIAYIEETEDDIVDLGLRHLRAQYLGDNPYSVNYYGKIEDLKTLSLDQLAAYKNSVLVADDCVVAVSGAIDREKLERSLSRILEKLPKRGKAMPLVGFDEPATVGRSLVDVKKKQAVVFQAFPCVGLRDDDATITASVLDELFSGMSSNLFEQVRDEKGLAYYVGSNRVIGLDTGMFYLYGGTQPESAEQVLEEMSLEIERIQAGKVEQLELDRIKIRLLAQRRMSMQTISSRAMQAGLNVVYDMPANDWLNFDKKLEAVTIERLQEFAVKYFNVSKRLELVVGPKG